MLKHHCLRFDTLCVILLIFISGHWSSQKLTFTQFGVRDGLPQSTVYEIFQDLDGYLWLGTDGGGLCRYDGYRFKTYGRKEGLNGNVVRRIAQSDDSTLWIATGNGLYTLRGDSVVPVRNIPTVFFTSVYKNSRNEIWAATSGHGLYRITGDRSLYAVKHYDADHGLAGNFIFDIAEDEKGRMLLAEYGNGISTIDASTGKITTYRNSSSALNEIITLKRLKSGTLLCGTRSAGAYSVTLTEIAGKAEFEPVTNTANAQVWSICDWGDKSCLVATDRYGAVLPDSHEQFDLTSGMPTNRVYKVFRDRENNLWIGTNSAGLLRYSGKRFTFLTDDDVAGLTQISAIAQDKNGYYWLGSANGLFKLNRASDRINLMERFTVKSGLPSNDVTSVVCDLRNRIWVGTRKGLCIYASQKFIKYTEASGLVNQNINCLFLDQSRNMWVGSFGGLNRISEKGEWITLSEVNGLVNNEVQCLLEDKSRNIWIGTLGGLMKFDGDKLHVYDESDGLTEKKIHCLAADSRNNIYIGTSGGGIYRLGANDPKPVFKTITEEAELLSNNINSLTFISDSVLIAGTNQGLVKLIVSTEGRPKSVVILEKDDGFINPETGLNAALRDDQGHVWLGTPEGVTLYKPEHDRINEVKPLMRLRALLVNGSPRSVQDLNHLRHDENSLTVSFVAISLTSPSRNEYFAKLRNYDTNWIRIPINKSDQNNFCVARYNKLPPGKYELLLRSVNNDGTESNTLSIKFKIAQPFYRAGWFIILTICAAALFVLMIIKYREKKLRRAKATLERLVELRTHEVNLSKKEIEKQKDLLEIQQQEITDSINYSKRIQNAILPDMRILKNRFPDSFVLYRPKDIVSGDFFYFRETPNGSFYLAVADCTGHGVPGAFMSMLGNKELGEVVKTAQSPGAVLKAVNKGIRETLNQGGETDIRDGMDIALLQFAAKINGQTSRVTYSSANRPLWMIKAGCEEVFEIKATKAAIGGLTDDEQDFAEHELTLRKGDILYMSSDGYADQFGGPGASAMNAKKMMTKRFREALLACRKLPMEEQGVYLAEYFDRWKGPYIEQVDDVLVIGVRI
jgi:ligand-binding sensor domain-containing protein/serine phosphatase RsbU (regulator of sigma subunit)